MEEQKEKLSAIAQVKPYKIIISKPAGGEIPYRRIVIERKESYYQAAAYTEKQVFHENIPPEKLAEYLGKTVAGQYLQVNAWDDAAEHMYLCSKKGKVTYKTKKNAQTTAKASGSHNRKKQYILEEGTPIAPLVDMGVFTPEGKVVRTMYDKFRQINRFLEMVEDAVGDDTAETLHIIDFGCGKSYLTFVLYYYFTEIQKRNVQIAGLDLKADVIKNCNAAAKKYGYENLHFEVGDINGYRTDAPVDMVVTLHACDTATDYALAKAVEWGAEVILSVPCCQHEVNKQIKNEMLEPVLRYGILKERMSALITDAVRADLLESKGYDTQILEFIDMEHTPKNLLIRAVRTGKRSDQGKVEQMLAALNIHPTLDRLLNEKEQEGSVR